MGGLISQISLLSNWWKGWLSQEAESPEQPQPYKEFVQNVVMAVKEGSLESLQTLQEDGSIMMWGGLDTIHCTPSLVQSAASHGHIHILRYLLDLGADVDEVDSCKMCALHEACKKNQNECVKLLVNKTRYIDRKDIWGRTPLIKALVYRNFEAAELLLEKGANPNAVDIYGITPLSTIIDYDNVNMLRKLVHHGADVNLMVTHMSQYKCSRPPIYLAIINQNVTMVKELIRLGATTQPRQQDYASNWYFFNGGSTGTGASTNLPHNNAVMMAMSELVRRNQNNIDVSGPGMEILMNLLTAHGHPLGSSPDILIRVLISSQQDDFSKLLYKLQLCSSSSQENMLLGLSDRDSNQRSPAQPQHLQQMDQYLRGGKKQPRIVMCLQNQARRVARQAMMTSGHNVVWATKRLQCPPALKTLLLLKDIDRAYSPSLRK